MQIRSANEHWRGTVQTALIVLALIYVCGLPLHIAFARLEVRRQALRTLVRDTHSRAAIAGFFLDDRRDDLRELVDSQAVQRALQAEDDPRRQVESVGRLLRQFGMERRFGDEPVFSALIFVPREGGIHSVSIPDAKPLGLTLEALRSMVKQLFIRPTYLSYRMASGQPALILSVAVVSDGTVDGQLLAVMNPSALDTHLREAVPFSTRALCLLTPGGDVYLPGGTPGAWREEISALATSDVDTPMGLKLPEGNGREGFTRQIGVRSSVPASDYSIVCLDQARDIPTIGNVVRLSGLYFLAGVTLAAAAGLGLTRRGAGGSDPDWASEPGEGMRVLNTLFDHLPDGVLIADSEGKVQFVNRAFESQRGVSLDAARGQYAAALLGEVVQEEHGGPMSRALQGRQTWVGRVRSVRHDGSTFTSETFVFPVQGKDHSPAAVVAVSKDITPRVQAEERLRQAQKMEAVGVLTDGIAHDFNNLLTVIQGNCNLLLYGADSLDTFARENIDEILRACDRAASMTRRLLAFSRHREVQMQVLDLNEVVASTEKMLTQLIRENVKMDLALAKDPVYVKADLVQLEQVIINLTVNARDAMPRGGKLSVRVAPQRLKARERGLSLDAGDYAVLSVADTGHGMDEETRGRIFDPFFTTKNEKEGTGLGLTTVMTIVEEHGGTISVESKLTVGTTFQVYLPLYAELPAEQTDSEARAERHAKPRRMPSEYPRGEGPGVLVLDDEESVLRMIERALDAHGYNVFAARTDVELLVAWEKHQAEIDLLITDMVMPGMSGVEIADRLRQDNPTLKVLSISAYTDTVIMKLGGKERNDTLFLQKPFSPDTLVSKVDDMLAQHAEVDTASASS